MYTCVSSTLQALRLKQSAFNNRNNPDPSNNQIRKQHKKSKKSKKSKKHSNTPAEDETAVDKKKKKSKKSDPSSSVVPVSSEVQNKSKKKNKKQTEIVMNIAPSVNHNGSEANVDKPQKFKKKRKRTRDQGDKCAGGVNVVPSPQKKKKKHRI